MDDDVVRYYPYLKEKENVAQSRYSLLNAYRNREHDLNHGVVVCRVINIEGRSQKRFACFKNHIMLFKHMMQIKQEERAFFEVIFGHLRQKPHFDIDIESQSRGDNAIGESRGDNAIGESQGDNAINGDDVLREVVRCIWQSCEQYKVVLGPDDLLLYTSNSSSNGKQSYHIVINNWAHNNNKEAKAFAMDVKNRVKPEYKPYLDPVVYKSKQQFRLLYCNKLGSNRVKRPILLFEVDGKQVKYPDFGSTYEGAVDEFYASLVSRCDGCASMPIVLDPTKPFAITDQGAVNIDKLSETNNNLTRHEDMKEIKLTRPQVNECLFMLSDAMGYPRNSLAFSNLFHLREVQGSIISLNRRRPYKCIICGRKHDNENPFITVSHSGGVFYHCRRAEDSMRIGEIHEIAEQYRNTLLNNESLRDNAIHGEGEEDVTSSTTPLETQLPVVIQKDTPNIYIRLKSVTPTTYTKPQIKEHRCVIPDRSITLLEQNLIGGAFVSHQNI